jgi:acyl-CoA dehydrogenase
VAGFYSVFAVTAPHGGARRLSAFAIPADAPGLSVRQFAVLGSHPIGELRLDAVRIPKSARIGDEGGGMAIALGALATFRPSVGAAAVGFASRALDESIHHVRERRQFGGPLADLQGVQLSIAEMACDVDASRLLVLRAAAASDAGAARGVVVKTGSMAKLFATEAAQRVIDRAVQLHGARGVLEGSVVARLYQCVRALRIYEGTNDIQRLLVARELLREGSPSS